MPPPSLATLHWFLGGENESRSSWLPGLFPLKYAKNKAMMVGFIIPNYVLVSGNLPGNLSQKDTFSRWWFQFFFEFSPRKLGKISNLTNIFQMG